MYVVAVIFSTAVVQIITALTPPSIYQEPEETVYFKPGERLELPCAARGDPIPRFYWKRNEVKFEPKCPSCYTPAASLPYIGKLVFNNIEARDEGMYKCFAENDLGTSVSKLISLRAATLENFAETNVTIHEPNIGASLTLQCTPPKSVPSPEVLWMLKGPTGLEPFYFDYRVSMDREYKLQFSNVIPGDRANGKAYVCVALNNVLQMKVEGPAHYIEPGGSDDYREPSFLFKDPDDRLGLLGETLSTMCIPSGYPTPWISWNFEELSSASIVYSSLSQELLIENLQFENEGTYECEARNELASSPLIQRFHLRVESKPYFIQEPKDVEVGVGEDVEIVCQAGGRPKPTIDWFINGVELQYVTDPRIVGPNSKVFQPDTNKLVFEKLEKTDSLVIQCNASNTHGWIYSDFYINVFEEAPIMLTPPEAVKLAAEGQPVNLTCRTKGMPNPVVSWFRHGEQVTGGPYSILPSGDLHIKSVVMPDEGHYRCEAWNRYGSVSAVGSLVVRRRTRIVQAPPDLGVNAGENVNLQCTATTDPAEVHNLKILWLRDNRLITEFDQRFITAQDGSLILGGTIRRDSGIYTCIATNGLDNDTASATLTVTDRPDPPTNVYTEFCSMNVTVRWTPGADNGAPIQFYIIEYKTSFVPNQWIFGTRVNTFRTSALWTSANLTLSPYGNYTFRVTAYNRIGPSDPSWYTQRVCTTTSRRPDQHPRNLRTVGKYPEKLHIEWTPMPKIQHNGPGFRYKLEILRVGAPESELLTRNIDNWEINYFEMSARRVYERFRITIKAENNDGEAVEDPPPTIMGHSYEEKPTIIPQLVVVVYATDTSAKLSWTFDKSQIGNYDTALRGEFRGFKILFWERNHRGTTVREQDVGPESADTAVNDTFTARLYFLVPNTEIEVEVMVKNNVYLGQPSEVVRFRTLPGLPGLVEYFQPINVEESVVSLEWSAPFEDRGVILGYDIAFQLVRGLNLGKMRDMELQIDDPYATFANLTGLNPSTKYRIHIFARTQKGRGESYFIETETAAPKIVVNETIAGNNTNETMTESSITTTELPPFS